MFSDSGAKIMSGPGLASVRHRIEDAFRNARRNTHTETSGKRIEIVKEVELVSVAATTPLPTPVRPLAERAQPIFRACERRLRHVVKRHSAVHYISLPTENAEQLYADALRSIKSRS